MPRYIDADALKRYIDCGHLRYPTELCFSELDVVRMLDKRPTVNATPVKHGRWVTDDLGHTHCSRCGERLPFMHCYSDEPCSDYDEEWDEEIPETRYCPNCGAKMNGGNDGAAD